LPLGEEVAGSRLIRGGYHVDTINGAKAADTRRRRIDKAIALFREGCNR
jgi:hypothetical protein